MKKYSFYNDYSEGAHQSILDMLSQTNLVQEPGYGLDSISLEAADLIKKAVSANVDVHFISGGTQANLTVIASILRPYEGVIAAKTGHIAVHEAGAIESTGHKILAVESADGKLTVDLIKSQLTDDEHMVKPKLVFISNATELGTIYNEQELKEISEFCKQHDLYLYMDGARLASGLMSSASDLDLPKVAKYVDIFYIGGTKNGALIGEAIVIVNDQLKKEFRYHLKQRGALLAKGKLLGIQFKALFTNNLYFEIAKHANVMAEKLTNGMKQLNIKFLAESTTNQIFPILSNDQIKKLEEMYGFYVWAKVDENSSAIRLVTSWATEEKMVDEFLSDLKALV
ncbi:MAG: low specificity L-threonine aldolase [Candidatus Dojkabacteria bacterium]